MVDGCSASSSGCHRDGDTGVAEAFDVTGDGAFGHAELVGELREGQPVTVGVEAFDEMLLTFDPAQCQQRVARPRCAIPGGSFHILIVIQDAGVSGLVLRVDAMDGTQIANSFFETYRRALLHRDAARIASHYAVPALIEFPDRPIPVTSTAQTEEFFASAMDQYQGVTRAHTVTSVVAETAHSVWADVTWTYDGDMPGERNLYQLVRVGDEWKIAVMTPLDS